MKSAMLLICSALFALGAWHGWKYDRESTEDEVRSTVYLCMGFSFACALVAVL